MSSDSLEAPLTEEQQRQIPEKPVTTKDIANLYSHLQTMIDNVPKSPRLEVDGEPKQQPYFPITPTLSSKLPRMESSPRNSSSNLILNKRIGPKEPDCPCHHILVSKDSTFCALCDDVIPILSEIQHDRESKRIEIQDYKATLSTELEKSTHLKQEIETLQSKSKELTEKLNTTTEKYTSLQKDMHVLQQKLDQEKSNTAEAMKAKSDLENELEDLSQKLFEEANVMVANERREKHQIEGQLKHLQQELKNCHEQLEAEEMQLKELRLKMGYMEEQHKRDSRASGNLTEDQLSILNDEENEPDKRASRDLAGLFTHEISSSVSLISVTENEIDPLNMNEFKEFVESGETIPIRKLHNIPFMKNTLIEDVEPCLRFGPNSRLSAKKLYEAIALNTCFIEEAPFNFAIEQAKRPYDVPLRISAAKNMIWERLSTSAPVAPFAGCQACGRNVDPKTPLPYRFRISILDDWACIDRFCRDRLVAVCEFYLFVRNIRHGYYNGRTVENLYNETTRLKLQMFYARMGSLALMLQTIGIKGDKVGQASAPNMIIPPPAVVIEDEDVTSVSDKRSSMNSILSDSSNEDDKYFEDTIVKEQEPTNSRRVSHSIHPGNPVWAEHSFERK